MTILPIVSRELQVAARRAGTYWMRFWAALLVLFVWLLVLTGSHGVSSVQMGQHLLNALGILALGFSMLAGIFVTSDCLSVERREGTLGLLFLTDLKAYDVIFGKLVAHSLHAVFGLLAIFPILGLALLLGGVTGREFARLVLVFLVTLFSSLNFGLLISAYCVEARQALGRTFLLILVFAGVLPLIWWLQWLLVRTPALDVLLLPSPAYAYMRGYEAFYRTGGGPQDYWWSLSTIFFLGLVCLVWANLHLPRSWQDKPAAPVPKLRNWPLFPTRPGGFQPRLALYGRNPFFWLSVRDPAPRKMVAKALLFTVPLWVVPFIASPLVWRPEEAFSICFFAAYGLHLMVKVLVASEASRRMHEDRQSGALELLLATPLPVRDILSGQKRALRSHFNRALVTLCLVNLAMLILVDLFGSLLNMQWRDKALFTEIFTGGILMVLLDFNALGWVGIWRGLNSRQHHRAVLATLGQIMGPPLLYFFLLLFLQPNVNSELGVAMVMASWFGVGILVDVFSSLAAQARLRSEFRAAVLERFQAGRS